MNNEPLCSVIIPIYNSEKTLFKCVQSVISQTVKNLEIILVDDGSDDNSLSICFSFKEKDKRVKVISQVNNGPSIARNKGLDIASGKYYFFVDSDDWIDNDYIQCLIEDSQFNKNAFVMQNYIYDNSEPFDKGFSSKLYNNIKDIDSFYRSDMLMYTGPHAKIFCGDIIRAHDIKFPEGVNNGEDGIFLFCYLKFVNIIYTSSLAKYHAFATANSIEKKYFPFDVEYKGFILFEETLQNLLTIKHINDDNDIITLRWSTPLLVRSIKSAYLNSINYKEAVKYLGEIPNLIYKKVYKNYKFNNFKVIRFRFFFLKNSYFLTFILMEKVLFLLNSFKRHIK